MLYITQALLRRWRTLDLTAAPRKILGFTMVLSLAPAHLIDASEEGLRIIQEKAD